MYSDKSTNIYLYIFLIYIKSHTCLLIILILAFLGIKKKKENDVIEINII